MPVNAQPRQTRDPARADARVEAPHPPSLSTMRNRGIFCCSA